MLSTLALTLTSLSMVLNSLSSTLPAQQPILATKQPLEATIIEEKHNIVSEPENSIKTIIISEAIKYGVDIDLALYLAQIESNFNPKAKNPYSSAVGLFQFITGTWLKHCEGDRENPVDNSRCAMKMIADGGIGHWTADPTTRDKLLKAGFIKENNELANRSRYLDKNGV